MIHYPQIRLIAAASLSQILDGAQSQYELESTTERPNAVYGDGSVSALDEVLEALQFLSLPDDDKW